MDDTFEPRCRPPTCRAARPACNLEHQFLGAQSVAVLPYEQYLNRFPAYLQQLTMESTGKASQRMAPRSLLDLTDCVGRTRHQWSHSFYQLITRARILVACDFIGFCRSLNSVGNQHDVLLANMLAQSEALAFGKTADQVNAEGGAGTSAGLVPHRTFEGNRPSNTIVGDALTPQALGTLVALYEHSVFVQGAIWNIDSFDQWGVELGKALAQRISSEIASEPEPRLTHDDSTNSLIRRYRARR